MRSYTLKDSVKAEVKAMLPGIREELSRHIPCWDNKLPSPYFYSDDALIEMLPFAIFHFILIKKGCAIDKDTITWMLNNFEIKHMKEVVTIALLHLVVKNDAMKPR